MLTSARGLVLRPIEVDDVGFVAALRNDLAIERLAGSGPPIPRLRSEFEQNLADERVRRACSDGSPSSIELICEVEGTAAGIGGVYGIDHTARHAELGVSLADGPWRGRGFGELAHRMLLSYAFEDLNLRRMHASVHADNTAVLALCEKLGFRIEGVRVDFRWVAGAYVDLVVFGMGRPDFAAAGGWDRR